MTFEGSLWRTKRDDFFEKVAELRYVRRHDMCRSVKQKEDVTKGFPKEITVYLQGMPFFLQPCIQNQIVITQRLKIEFHSRRLAL